jgi:hypothetical protein
MSLYLQQRLDELNREIRAYPGPIARCDLHLPALLDERNELIERLNKEPCTPEALWGHDGGRMND